jgi:hypothetical protein
MRAYARMPRRNGTRAATAKAIENTVNNAKTAQGIAIGKQCRQKNPPTDQMAG